MPNFISQGSLFLLGFVTVLIYGWQRFNEPSFPNQDALPRAVEPLRYLFLRLAYRHARFAYLIGLLTFYVALVIVGPSILAVTGAAGLKDFPPEVWALVAALFVAGFAPNTNKWVNVVEEQLRRWIHAWFLVPYGIQRTIAILQDARYVPPKCQLELVQSPLQEQIREDLKRPPSTLRHRWARATMLILSLRQMGAGATHPLKKAAFEPFEDEFEAIGDAYKALKLDVETFLRNPVNDDDKEQALEKLVNRLLKRIYAYISWGIRYEANSEADVDEVLEQLGFRVPPAAGQRLFDIVFPAAALVATITMAFWIIVDAVTWMVGSPAFTMSDTVLKALSSAVAASAMYGGAVLIALNRRKAQIEQGSWLEDSWQCLIPIAITAGLTTWLVIVGTTVMSKRPETWQSLSGLAHLVTSLAIGDFVHRPASGEWSFLPIKIATAMPWLLAGAVVSAMIASSVRGDVRRTDKRQRMYDAIAIAAALGLAAALSQLIQISISDRIFGDEDRPTLWFVPVVGLGGFACGGVIGLIVPRACRINVMTPRDPPMALRLQELLDEAESALGSKDAADDWTFTPKKGLRGITPAEALQFKAHATGVRTLLNEEAGRRLKAHRFDRTIEREPISKEMPRIESAAASLAPADDKVGA